MAIIKMIEGKNPIFGENCFFAENAVLIGNLQTGDECSFWFGSVVRADVNSIKMGNRVNVQDNAVIHCTYNKFPTIIGNNVSIGHTAIVHGCIIEDNVLIGMGAIVMDGCHVKSGSIIAAGSVVTQGKIVGENELWAGIPAKKIKEVSQDLKNGEIERIAANYVKYSEWYK